jgi:dihydropteroate synthase
MSSRWRLGDKLIDCTVPRVMAIANLTPDSFFAGSRVKQEPDAQRSALLAMLDGRVDLVDLGGQSTRPGSERVGVEEELNRVLPAIEEVRWLDDQIPITVDTYYSAVARRALAAGADGINDISGGRLDPELLPLVAEAGCGYVLMHMLGTPETMQREPNYADCLAEVREFFQERLAALDGLGVAREAVVLDPGIGFGKRLADNVALVRGAGKLAELGRPLLYGISRKSFIGALGNQPDAARRLAGTLGLTWELLSRGVMLHRVHDAVEARQLLDVWAGFQDCPQISEN